MTKYRVIKYGSLFRPQFFSNQDREWVTFRYNSECTSLEEAKDCIQKDIDISNPVILYEIEV